MKKSSPMWIIAPLVMFAVTVERSWEPTWPLERNIAKAVGAGIVCAFIGSVIWLVTRKPVEPRKPPIIQPPA